MKRVLSTLIFVTLLLITWPGCQSNQEVRIDDDDLGGAARERRPASG